MWRLIVASTLVFCGSIPRAAADGPDETISAVSTSNDQSVMATGTVAGTVGGGYSGSDGVLDCVWLVVGDRPGSTHESYSPALSMIQGWIYLFECRRIADGVLVEHDWRVFDPPAGNPVVDLRVTATNRARELFDREQLPEPALGTAPPGSATIPVNVPVWFWVDTPPSHQVSTNLDANNHSTVTANPASLEIRSSDGSSWSCPGGGVAWEPGMSESTPGHCAHTFGSAADVEVVVTLRWTTTFDSVVAGQRFTGALGDRTTTTRAHLRIREYATHLRPT